MAKGFVVEEFVVTFVRNVVAFQDGCCHSMTRHFVGVFVAMVGAVGTSAYEDPSQVTWVTWD